MGLTIVCDLGILNNALTWQEKVTCYDVFILLLASSRNGDWLENTRLLSWLLLLGQVKVIPYRSYLGSKSVGIKLLSQDVPRSLKEICPCQF